MPKRTKSSARWLAEHASDEFVKRARAEGWRSRAVFKLAEIQATERLLSGKVAPGGGVVSLGEIFDARDFLAALDTVTVSYGAVSNPILTRRNEHEQQ